MNLTCDPASTQALVDGGGVVALVAAMGMATLMTVAFGRQMLGWLTASSRAKMDPLAALLSQLPPQQLSATELRSRRALLEDAAQACNDELALAELCLKMGVQSCKELREEKEITWYLNGLSTTDLATLGKLAPKLPALEKLHLVDNQESGSAGPDVGRLFEELRVWAGALPAVTHFDLEGVCVGDAGASALAAALDQGALPRLKELYLDNTDIGDAGLVALAPTLRRLPALEVLALYGNPFGDEGLAALVAPPPVEAQPPQADALAKLKMLNLGGTLITDVGCADLASKLPALVGLGLDNTTDISDAARAAVLAAIGQRRAP